MSYQVLARKWRPRRFEEMVGQGHVLQALINALNSDRLHHAYLFTGTRGVGKTTVARIFAKALNCEQGVSAEPCGECSACREIDEGRFIDLIEVDAASRTGVDDTRDLLDNVQYAPARGRYKVYLIDEVHMFSKSSFNALLKTLEEPPPHIKFLLATTDPKRLPVTVLSRCLQFNLKRLSVEQIETHLGELLKAEGIATDEASPRLIATAADGSVRDALSLLDQSIAYSGGTLKGEEISAMLGVIDRKQVLGLLECLAQADGASLLRQCRQLAELNPDYAHVLGELLALLQQIAIMQVVPDMDADAGIDPRLGELASALAADYVQLCYQIGLIGRRDLPLAPDPAGGFEMILLRMLAFQPLDGEGAAASGTAAATKTKPVKATAQVEPAPSKVAPAPVPVAAPIPIPAPETPVPEPKPDRASAAGMRPGDATASGDTASPAAGRVAPCTAAQWPVLIEELRLGGLVKQLAANCVLASHQDGRMTLVLPAARQQLRNSKSEQRLAECLREVYGPKLRLRIEISQDAAETLETPAAIQAREAAAAQQQAEQRILADPGVQALCDTFGARVDTASIKPLTE